MYKKRGQEEQEGTALLGAYLLNGMMPSQVLFLCLLFIGRKHSDIKMLRGEVGI